MKLEAAKTQEEHKGFEKAKEMKKWKLDSHMRLSQMFRVANEAQSVKAEKDNQIVL